MGLLSHARSVPIPHPTQADPTSHSVRTLRNADIVFRIPILNDQTEDTFASHLLFQPRWCEFNSFTNIIVYTH